MCYTNPFEWVMIFFFTPKDNFSDNLGKNLTVAGVLRINIWFSLPIPKIKFGFPNKGKMLWCSYFKSFIKLTMIFFYTKVTIFENLNLIRKII